MIDLEKAQQLATDWLAAWNAHDLEAVLSHYADELEFVSPLVAERLGWPDGTIRTKAELATYFEVGLGSGSELQFELADIFTGISGITLLYRNHRRLLVAETMILNEAGLVTRVYVHHRPD